MKKLRVISMLLILAGCISLLAALLVTANQNTGQQENSQAGKLPSGNWTVSARPYLGADFRELPVITTSVGQDPEKGLGAASASVSNASLKTVSALKFTWYILKDETDRVLLQGQTPLIAITGGMPKGGTQLIDFPIADFSSVMQPLIKAGSLTGDYRVEVLVSEVVYEDGSTWARSENRRLAMVLASKVKFVKAGGSQQGCCPMNIASGTEQPTSSPARKT
ncbi:MAG TPA: hypothetical protein DC047_01365 [Blastocatellia bacterium]|nr:hypothetical protein [Blastocatellia bacterium]